MYVYKKLVTDDACKKNKLSIIHKIRRRAGIYDIYLICLAGGRDTFDIIDCMNLKQKGYPKTDLYILGIAKGKESATELAAKMFVTFSAVYGTILFKEEILEQKDTLFRRY